MFPRALIPGEIRQKGEKGTVVFTTEEMRPFHTVTSNDPASLKLLLSDISSQSW